MANRPVLLFGACVVIACGTDPDPTPADIAGTWVLRFPFLYVPGNGYQCESQSGTVLQIVQDGDRVEAPYHQGLLVCATNALDSIQVFFTQGQINGVIDGNSLDLSFEGTPGSFTGTINGDEATGEIDYHDATFGVAISGTWTARRRTPTGALNLAFTTTSLNELSLPPVLLLVDGDTAIQVPPNGTQALTGLTGGQHILQVTNGDGRSCAVSGGPSGSMGGRNPNSQPIDITEGAAPRTVSYILTCT